MTAVRMSHQQLTQQLAVLSQGLLSSEKAESACLMMLTQGGQKQTGKQKKKGRLLCLVQRLLA